MLRFAVRRLLLLVPILIGLSLLVFIWIRALPGSPAQALLGERATDESIAQVRDQYGLDDPLYEQYWRYLQTVGSGDLGTSIASRRPITEEIQERFPATIELAICGDAVRDPDRDPARLRRGEATRAARSTTRASSSR